MPDKINKSAMLASSNPGKFTECTDYPLGFKSLIKYWGYP